MRNNEDRFAPTEPQIPPSSVTNMHYVAPTELVNLPSKGLFYPKDHPLYGKEYIEIKHMTTKEEDILSSTTFIQKGVVLDYLLKSIITDKSIDVKSLLPGDQNAIFVSARINAYGPEYSLNFSCGQCGKTNNLIKDLSEFSPKANLEHYTIDNGLINVNLQKSGLNVKLKQLSVKETDGMSEYIQKNEKMGLSYGSTTSLLLFIIHSINGEENKKDMNAVKIIENLPSRDVRQIKSVYVDSKPDIDFEFTFQCQHCGHKKEENLPITANFFWPDA